MASLLNIGASGLRAQQAALTVTGQNITNADTEGYSRQRVNAGTQLQGLNGSRFVGAGVRLNDIERISDAFAEAQLLSDTSLFAQTETLAGQIEQIDAVLFDSSGGLSGALERFFTAVNAAAATPDSLPERQLVLSEADGVAERFASLDGVLRAASDGFDAELASVVGGINELSDSIAQLNERIANLGASSSNGALNGLLDQRQALLADLSALADLQVTQQSDNQVSVLLGKGEPLVLGASARPLAVVGGQVVTQAGSQQRSLGDTGAQLGGQLGGLLAFKQGVLDPTTARLGQLAFTLVVEVNRIQESGIDLQGSTGRPIFAELNQSPLPELRVQRLNSQAAVAGGLELRVLEPTQVPLSAYELSFSNVAEGNFSVKRLSDGAEVAQGQLAGKLDQTLNFDGLELALGGDIQPGSRYRLDPFGDAAANVQLSMSDAQGLAFAEPLRAISLLSNTGNAELQLGDVFDPQHPLLADPENMPPLLVRFSDDNTFDVFDYRNPTAPTPLDPPARHTFVPGQQGSAVADAANTQLLVGNGPLTQQFSPPEIRSEPVSSLGYGYPPQEITLTDSVTQVQQSVQTAEGASARQVAQALSTLPGVVARADTDLILRDLLRNDTGVSFQIALNGVVFNDVVSLDDFADRVADSQALADQGVNIQRLANSDSHYRLRDSQGDELVLQVQGDSGEGITLARQSALGATTQFLGGAGIGDPGLVQGSVDIRSGFNFAVGGPYSLSLATQAGQPPIPINIIGNYSDANELREGFQQAIDQAVGTGQVQVAIGPGGLIRLTTVAVGSDAQLDLTVNGALENAVGLISQQASGVDRLSSISAFGQVSLEAQPGLTLRPSNSGVFSVAQAPQRADLGFAFNFTGVPAAGDGFVVEFNRDGSSDNRNALRLGALQSTALVGDPPRTLVEGYAELVEAVGSKAAQAATDKAAAETLLTQSIARREAVSGVNLDEEAANLIRFEQAYNASAQVISVARDVFNSLLNAVR